MIGGRGGVEKTIAATPPTPSTSEYLMTVIEFTYTHTHTHTLVFSFSPSSFLSFCLPPCLFFVSFLRHLFLIINHSGVVVFCFVVGGVGAVVCFHSCFFARRSLNSANLKNHFPYWIIQRLIIRWLRRLSIVALPLACSPTLIADDDLNGSALLWVVVASFTDWMTD